VDKISVIGSGSWATALVKIFTENKCKVNWYVRRSHVAKQINESGRNPNYISYLTLDVDYLEASSNLEEIVRSSDYVLFALPSAFVADLVGKLDPEIFKSKKILVSIKGMVSKTNQTPLAFILDQLRLNPEDAIVLGGPCHAEEIAQSRKTYMTIAGKDSQLIKEVLPSFQSTYIQLQRSGDIWGIEYAAIYKNVVGVACGIAKGLNYGDNFQAVLVANAIEELTKLLDLLIAPEQTLNSSSYLGDLLVTGYSNLSRNRTFGELIGRGYNTPDAERAMSMVAEGYYAVKGLYPHIEKDINDFPILSTVYRIIYNNISPFTEFKLLEKKLR